MDEVAVPVAVEHAVVVPAAEVEAPASQTEVIEAEAEAAVAVIEAQSEATVAEIEAQGEAAVAVAEAVAPAEELAEEIDTWQDQVNSRLTAIEAMLLTLSTPPPSPPIVVVEEPPTPENPPSEPGPSDLMPENHEAPEDQPARRPRRWI